MAEMNPSDIIKNLVQQTRKQDDIFDQYRDENEDTKHWHCRKQFIRHNYSKFFPTTDNLPEEIFQEKKDRLDCLSKCWANVQFYQTEYPIGVMNKIQEMSYGMSNLDVLLREGADVAHREALARVAMITQKYVKHNIT